MDRPLDRATLPERLVALIEEMIGGWHVPARLTAATGAGARRTNRCRAVDAAPGARGPGGPRRRGPPPGPRHVHRPPAQIADATQHFTLARRCVRRAGSSGPRRCRTGWWSRIGPSPATSGSLGGGEVIRIERLRRLETSRSPRARRRAGVAVPGSRAMVLGERSLYDGCASGTTASSPPRPRRWSLSSSPPVRHRSWACAEARPRCSCDASRAMPTAARSRSRRPSSGATARGCCCSGASTGGDAGTWARGPRLVLEESDDRPWGRPAA